MLNLNQDIPAFKEHLRDFLVQIKVCMVLRRRLVICRSRGYTARLILHPQEFAGEDDSDLYTEERLATLKAAQEEKRKVQMSVPGILNPHEIPEEMQD